MRNRQADLLKLATQVLNSSANSCTTFGLDEKRPFGFSGQVGCDVCEIIGWPPEDPDGLTDEQVEYGNDLFGEVGNFIVKTWVRLHQLENGLKLIYLPVFDELTGDGDGVLNQTIQLLGKEWKRGSQEERPTEAAPKGFA